MRIYKIFIIGLLAALIGCATIKTNTDKDSWKIIQVANIELRYPAELTERPSADDHRIIDNDNDRNDLNHPQEYRIEITPQIESCSPTTLGLTAPTDLSEGAVKTLKGRVDYFDGGKDIYSMEPRPLCIPPSLNGLSDEEIGKFAKTRAAYAFCSQKDGKTVVVCISQMTKNEEVATKIFDSFKWTK